MTLQKRTWWPADKAIRFFFFPKCVLCSGDDSQPTKECTASGWWLISTHGTELETSVLNMVLTSPPSRVKRKPTLSRTKYSFAGKIVLPQVSYCNFFTTSMNERDFTFRVFKTGRMSFPISESFKISEGYDQIIKYCLLQLLNRIRIWD